MHKLLFISLSCVIDKVSEELSLLQQEKMFVYVMGNTNVKGSTLKISSIFKKA
jgi:hypothetical protein